MSSSLFPSQNGMPSAGPLRTNPGGLNMQDIQQIKQTMNALRGLKNPQQAIMQAAQKNPQLNAVLQMCQGRNPQEVFAEECKKYGVNSDAAMRQIQQILS